MMGYFPGMPGYNMAQGPVPSSSPSNNNRSSNTISIWAGDLDAYMDETFLRQAVTASGWGADITRIKVVRDHYSGMHAGYGFLDAASPEAAQRVIATGSGMPIPGTNRCWRLNMGRNAAVSASPGGSESSIYVGNLEPTVTDYQLMTAFRPRYASVRHAKVVCNEYGQSRGFGFVRFGSPQDAERAVAEMQGFVFNQKPIRLSPAAGRTRGGSSQLGGHGPSGGHRAPMHQYPHGPGSHGGPPTNKRPRQLMSPDDPNNTTIFIGGTANHVTEELLWREFSSFGELEAVRVPVNKTGFAFVRFKSRDCAQRAKDEVSGTPFASLNPNRPVRIEWASEQIPILKPGPPPGIASGSFSGSGSQPFDSQYSQYGEGSGNDGGSNANNQNGFSGNYSGNQGDGQGAGVSGGSSNKQSSGDGDGAGAKGDVKSGGADAPSLKQEDTGANHLDASNHNNGGETEPPSKRAAVGRPEYSANASEAPNKTERTESKADGGTEDSPGMQFSWLNASSSQPGSNPQ